mmetsp:Transcript_3473/g.10240  ORF Transcript_3473/g.10240 Transcript_3473/m.10240 type:complete len:111 (-) Transcript_3473:227-559(-)
MCYVTSSARAPRDRALLETALFLDARRGRAGSSSGVGCSLDARRGVPRVPGQVLRGASKTVDRTKSAAARASKVAVLRGRSADHDIVVENLAPRGFEDSGARAVWVLNER